MFTIQNHRASHEKLQQKFRDAYILDVTSRGPEPWIRFSPFYPHYNIPVPLSPDHTSSTVEGIWQGLKVFEQADVDLSKFAISSMKGIKRSARGYGAVLGHRNGVKGDRLLSYLEARYAIYLPAYHWVLTHRLQELITRLRELEQEKTVVLLDYETNCDIADLKRPLSHAGLIKRYIEGDWPFTPQYLLQTHIPM